MKDDTKRASPEWYERGIGAFCGGFLGLCIAALLAMFIGNLSTTVVVALLSGASVVGGLLGFLFPCVTETLWWVFSIFS
jgi:Mg/Co/Ni transporter MgtE